MIRHIVLWKLKPQNKAENRDMLTAMLISLQDFIPEIKNMSAGKNINSSEWDMALVMDVESPEALETYKIHPKHKLVAEFSKRISVEVHSVDFEI